MTSSNSTSTWVESEEGISSFFLIFLSLLALVLILSKCIHDRPRLMSFLSEAGMTILVGIVASYLIFLFSPVSDDNGNNDDNESGGNEDNFGLDKGLAEGLLSFSPNVFFVFLLPPIIFNSGYHLKNELFFRHLTPISLFACVGTSVSTLSIALLLQIAKALSLTGNDFQQPNFSELLAFGALISTTDPVSTLAIFQTKKVDPHLFYLVFGESVLNDAVGLVLYQTLSGMVGKNYGFDHIFVVVLEFFVEFLITFVGSMVMGVVCGMIAALLLKYLDMRKTPLLELSFFLLIVYFPFLLASIIKLSGIVTILFTGISAKRYAEPNLSDITQIHASLLFTVTAHLAEICIFLELGLSFFGISTGNFHALFVFWAIVACLIGRALNVYSITWCYNISLLESVNDQKRQKHPHPSEINNQNNVVSEFNRSTNNHHHDRQHDHPDNDDCTLDAVLSTMTTTPMRKKDLKIRSSTAHMLWFSGLRGAVAYACAKTFPNNFGNRNTFVCTTMGIVLFTVFIFGGTTEMVLNKLNIDMNIDEDEYMKEENTKEKMGYIRQFENRYLFPYLIIASQNATTTNCDQRGQQVQYQETLSTNLTNQDERNNTLGMTYSEDELRSWSFMGQIEMTSSDHLNNLCREGYISVDAYRKRKQSLYDYGHG